MFFERKSLNDILNETPELRVRGNWVCLNIETSAAWPTKPQPFIFEGYTIWIIPHTTDNYPGLAIIRPESLGQDEANALLHRALSLLVWLEDKGAVVTHVSGGNLPHMMGLGKGSTATLGRALDLTDLPRVPSEKTSLALALMREGRGLNHPAYAFLSFYKVLELAIPDGRVRGRWVTDNIDQVEGIQAKQALKKLRGTIQGDIGEHLLESGRQAIAHAKFDPNINPDDPRDARRLCSELPIIEALAVLTIEQHLGIQTHLTMWREHLYELSGWKAVLGDGLISAVLAGDPTGKDQQIDAPIINVRLRRSSPFSPFEGMTPLQIGLKNDKIEVVYESVDKRVKLVFWINLAEERLEFDAQESVLAYDDGSAAAARNMKELERFFRDYFGNGELQMWNVETGALISRRDAFLPHNIMPDFQAANAAIAKWDSVIAGREQAEARPVQEPRSGTEEGAQVQTGSRDIHQDG